MTAQSVSNSTSPQKDICILLFTFTFFFSLSLSSFHHQLRLSCPSFLLAKVLPHQKGKSYYIYLKFAFLFSPTTSCFTIIRVNMAKIIVDPQVRFCRREWSCPLHQYYLYLYLYLYIICMSSVSMSMLSLQVIADPQVRFCGREWSHSLHQQLGWGRRRHLLAILNAKYNIPNTKHTNSNTKTMPERELSFAILSFNIIYWVFDISGVLSSSH